MYFLILTVTPHIRNESFTRLFPLTSFSNCVFRKYKISSRSQGQPGAGHTPWFLTGERRQPQLSIPIYYAFPQIKSKLRIKSLLKFRVPLTFKALVKTVNCHLLNDADTKQSKKTGILPEVLL